MADAGTPILTILTRQNSIFVAVPKIAQSKVNEAELEIQGVNMLKTKEDQYELQINSTIRTDGKIHAKVYAFEGAMYLEDEEEPFAIVNFPDTSSDKFQEVNITQHTKIENPEAFEKFNIAFHNEKTLHITVSGKTQVKPRGLSRKYDVDFKKTLEIKGLDVFAGTKVTEGHITLKNDKEGKNFHGVAEIPNASVFTLDIVSYPDPAEPIAVVFPPSTTTNRSQGNVSFINFVEDTHMGSLYIDNLILHPGVNVVNISANIDQIEAINFVNSAKYCGDGLVPFKLLGDNVTNFGENITYFAAALASTNQTVPIDIGAIIKADLDYDVKCSKDD